MELEVQMETIFVGILISGFVIIVSIDAGHKRQEYLKTGK
jgi:hypothetical protein